MKKLKKSYQNIVSELKKVDYESRELTAQLIKNPFKAMRLNKQVSKIRRNACVECGKLIKKKPLNTINYISDCVICNENKKIREAVEEMHKAISKEIKVI